MSCFSHQGFLGGGGGGGGSWYFVHGCGLCIEWGHSLRSKRFGKAFRTFDALFAFLAAGKLGRAQKVRGGGGERREGNACTQTPRF